MLVQARESRLNTTTTSRHPAGRMKMQSRCLLAFLCLAVAGATTQADAAGTAFAVDTSEVSEAGSCKVEAWLSTANNGDLVAVTNPSCVVDVFRPMEFSAQITRTRADDEWATTISPKAKMKLVPTQIGSFGLAVAAGTTLDQTLGQDTLVFAYVPATLRLSEIMRININGGWQWDRIADRHFLTYGLGWDWRITDILTFTAETFGQLGNSETSTDTQPRFQAGLRIRPVDRLSFDFIYGHNINGEGADWFTFAATVRFPP
jgi:hypothetical protein